MADWIDIEHVDALPVRGTTLADLDMQRVTLHLQGARMNATPDPLAYLQHQRGVVPVMDTLVPTLGGLLCFGHDPQRWLPHTGIALTRYASATANSQQVLDIRDVRGSLFTLIDQTEAYIWAQSNHGFRLESGPRRIPIDQYPRTAIRELIVNAVAHRDYRVIGSRVKIEMFRNEIEWASPGGLPPGITIDNILKSQYTRNPVLVSFLFDAGYIEQRGMGLDTVVNILNDEQLPYPTMEDVGATFLVRISGHGAVDKHTTMGLSAPLAQIYTLVEAAGSEGITARAIAERLGVSVRTINHRLREMLERRLLARSGSTNTTRYLIPENGF